MLLMDDMQLLQAYVTQGSDEAFETILNRHLNLVYSTALRQVRDPVLAGEVTQTTFIILARKAASLGQGTILSGWLYRTAQFAAARALRTEMRRREREKEAAEMQTEPSISIWEQLAPILDQAMASLGTADRNALVLRYFENKTARDVGLALGINEAAAQKRLVRAVEKLREFCTRKGVVISAVALTGLLSANAVQAAPTGVAVATAAVLKGGAVSTSTGTLTSGTLKLIAWTKFKIAALTGLGVVTAIAGTATFFFAGHGLAEPTFHSKKMSAWLQQLDINEPRFSQELHWVPWQTELHFSPGQIQAVQAIRTMGTNIMPYLIATLDKNYLTRFERMMGQSLPELDTRHRQAALALDALGSECKPWLGDLTRILRDGPTRKEAAIGLAAIGPEGWDVLIRTLPATTDAQACSIWALGSHHITVAGIEGALLASYATDRPIGSDIQALWALMEINPDDQRLIPLLIKGLKSNRSDLKWGSAVLLGRLGQKAAIAVPDLEALLHDADALVRHDVAQALEKIDPQAAARDGVSGTLTTQHVPKTILD